MIASGRVRLDRVRDSSCGVLGVQKGQYGVTAAEKSATDDREIARQESLAPRAGVTGVRRVEEPTAKDRRIELPVGGSIFEQALDVGRRSSGSIGVSGRTLIEARSIGSPGDPDDARKDEPIDVVDGREEVSRSPPANAIVSRPLRLARFRFHRQCGRRVNHGVDSYVLYYPLQRARVEHVAVTGNAAARLDEGGIVVVTHQPDHLVVAVSEALDESAAEHARCTGQEHSHENDRRPRIESLAPDRLGNFKPRRRTYPSRNTFG